MLKSIALATFSFVVFGASCASASDGTTSVDNDLKQMTLRQKIGQLFMIGFRGTHLSDGLKDALEATQPGAVIVFERNIQSARQISNLLFEAQTLAKKISGQQLLIATDQEGGDVIRVRTTMPLPSALAIGRSGDVQLALKAGEVTGEILRILGINMNLAPVLDISDPAKPGFVGTRTFGSDASLVARFGSQFAKGLADSGVLPTVKHFPGHGHTLNDSHLSSISDPRSLAEVRKKDVAPFFDVHASLGARMAVMVNHVSYPAIDPTGFPATFSRPIIQGLLRTEMGFSGLVITDDIGMAGASQIRDPVERVISAINAGVDMIMVTWNRKLQTELVLGLERAVLEGRVSRDRINESVRRVLQTKKIYANGRSKPPTDRELQRVLNHPDLNKIGESAVATYFSRSLKTKNAADALFAHDKELLVFGTNQRFLAGFKRALPGKSLRLFQVDLHRPDAIDRIMRANPTSMGLLYVSGYQVGRLAAQVSDDVASRMMLVTVVTKGVLPNRDKFRYVADVYYRHPLLGGLVANYYFATPQSESRTPASDVSLTQGVSSHQDSR